jgi:phosphoribosyl-AMP cyclohydrolase
VSFARKPNQQISIKDLEEGTEIYLDFSKIVSVAKSSPDVIPVVVQNHETKEIILVAYTNLMALEKTIQTRIATFWSTSRNELWIKGGTSGHYFDIIDIFVNCEQNSLVYTVRPKGN